LPMYAAISFQLVIVFISFSRWETRNAFNQVL
jgi:hypothetical protein